MVKVKSNMIGYTYRVKSEQMNEMLECVGFLNFVPRAKLRWKKRIIEKRNTIRSHVFVLFAPSLSFSTFMTYRLISITPRVL